MGARVQTELTPTWWNQKPHFKPECNHHLKAIWKLSFIPKSIFVLPFFAKEVLKSISPLWFQLIRFPESFINNSEDWEKYCQNFQTDKHFRSRSSWKIFFKSLLNLFLPHWSFNLLTVKIKQNYFLGPFLMTWLLCQVIFASNFSSYLSFANWRKLPDIFSLKKR